MAARSFYLIPCAFSLIGGLTAAALKGSPSASTDAPAVRYDGQIGADSYDWPEWASFWAFQPLRKPVVPAIPEPAGKAGPASSVDAVAIDAFIADRLRQNGVARSPEADKLTLLRRVTFDLTGLPPTPEEIREFLADASEDAYQKVVDRLLASPHYGEHWGRHWLDVARYTPGRVSFPGIKGAAGDSHYRDYVVRAFNTDKPYDRFVTEQLAGDLLPPVADRQQYLDQIIAPAFLSIGPWFDMETDPNLLRLEMIDEMINTTSKAFMGISVACARCHDHKFDPIPIQDYYALGGIFRSTRTVGDFSEFWRDGRIRQLRPLAMPDQVAANDAVQSQIDALTSERWATLQSRHQQRMAVWKANESSYRQAAAEIDGEDGARRPFTIERQAEVFDGQDNLRIAQLLRDGKAVEVIETQTPTAQWVKYKFEVPETAQYRMEALHSTDDRTPLEVSVNGEPATKEALVRPTGGASLTYQRWDVAATFELRVGLNFLRLVATGGNFPRIDRLRLVKVDPAIEAKIQAVADERNLEAKLLERFTYWPEEPWPTVADMEAVLDEADARRLAEIDERVAELSKQVKPYALAVAVTDQPEPVDLPVHLRGQTYRQSAYLVPRSVPRFLDHALPRPEIPDGQSGRLELAQWLSDPRHPLTSRVMVNRIWGWHFGQGLVDSPSDFGSRGSMPSHPELLDYLATKFIEQGWSVRKMHRMILLSQTYRQATRADGEDSAATDVDPDNRLLSHFPRRRLEAEALYDTMLSTTNALVRQPSDQPLEFGKSSNRAMYTLTTGRAPPGLGVDVRKMMALFDVETEGVSIGRRPVSATPSQSLFWLNSPLVKYFADRFAERLLKMDKLSDDKRVEMAHLLALGRSPEPEMAGQLLAFVQQAEEDGNSKQEAWSRLCQALYASTEFRYVN